VKVVDNNDGTYTCSYTPKTDGETTLHVQIETEAYGTGDIKDAPFTVHIVPGLPDPLNFGWEGLELDANGRRVVVAGVTDSFQIVAKDGFGNQLQNGGLGVEGKIKGPKKVDVEVEDHDDGTYTLSYTPTVVGDYQFSAAVDGQKIGGKHNPFPFVVVPAPASPENSVAFGDGTKKATVGKENPFTIQARDAFDNDLKMGGADVGGELVHLESGEAVPLEVVDNEDGTYSATYPDLTKAGEYELTPTLDGVAIKDTPIRLIVKPGGAFLGNTTVNFPEENIAGDTGPVVEVRDEHNNLRSGGGDEVHAELMPKSKLPPVPARDNGDGTFEVDYPPNCRGLYDVVIKVNGEEAPGGPYEVTIEENPLTEEESEQVDELLPSVANIFKRLLADATPKEREKILAAIADK